MPRLQALLALLLALTTPLNASFFLMKFGKSPTSLFGSATIPTYEGWIPIITTTESGKLSILVTSHATNGVSGGSESGARVMGNVMEVSKYVDGTSVGIQRSLFGMNATDQGKKKPVSPTPFESS
jgi:hypothetical protein